MVKHQFPVLLGIGVRGHILVHRGQKPRVHEVRCALTSLSRDVGVAPRTPPRGRGLTEETVGNVGMAEGRGLGLYHFMINGFPWKVELLFTT